MAVSIQGLHGEKWQNNAPEQVQNHSSSTTVHVEDAAAWLRVLSGFLIFVMTWGPATGTGAFQSFYLTNLLRGHSASEIAWIGSVQTFLLVSTGVVSGPRFDKGYLRICLIVGCCLCVVGFMLLSLCTRFYQIVLTQGIVFGVGSGLAYVPSMAMVSVHFTKNRPLAIGIVASGAGVGGVIFPIMIRKLQPQVGFPWTARIIGFLQLTIAIVALSILLRDKEEEKPPRKLFQFAALTELPFVLFSVGLFFQLLAYWIPFAYIPTYARVHLNTTEDLSFYLLMAANGASTFGRIFTAVAAQAFGAFRVFVIGTAISAIIAFCWIACDSTASFTAFCVLWGFFTSIVPSLAPVCAATKPMSPQPLRDGHKARDVISGGWHWDSDWQSCHWHSYRSE